MNPFHPRLLCLLLIAMLLPVATHAKPPEGVQEITFKSTHLNTDETFWVLTPPGYDDPANAERT